MELSTTLVKHDRNELTLKFKIQDYLEAISQNFILCGLVKVQFQIANFLYNKTGYYTTRYCSVTLKLTKMDASDKLNYSVKVESQILQIPGITYLCADQNPSNAHWQELYKYHDLYGNDPTAVIKEIDFKLCLNISACTSDGFAGLSNDDDLSDFELRGEDGSVRMHKAVLAGFSPVMKTMLSGEWKETSEAAVTIPNTSQKTLQHLKDFMYEQKLPDSGLGELAVLASCYMIKDLQECCTRKILTTLTVDNTVNILKFAVKNKMETLLLSILEIIQRGVFDVDNISKSNNTLKPINIPYEIEHSDFEIRGVDGTVRMHESVLLNFSPVMRAMSNRWKKISEHSIELDASVETLQHLNDYIYEQKIPDVGLENLVVLAASLMMDDLEKQCIEKLLKDLQLNDVASLIEFAADKNVDNLLIAVSKKIQNKEISIEAIMQWFKNTQ